MVWWLEGHLGCNWWRLQCHHHPHHRNVEWVVIACMALMDQFHLSDGIGIMTLFDVVATLGCGVVATLGHEAITLGVGASTVGGVVHCSAMIAVSSWMARICFIFSAVDVGTVPPNTLRRSAATAMESSCCKATGTWQWAGYKRQVSEKRKRHVAGM